MTASEDSRTMAERLREARVASGLSQGQVAKKLDLHRPTVTEIEAGRRKVSAQEIERFSLLYAVSVEWLISGSSMDDADERLLMAARELSRMKDADIDRLMDMLKMLRKRTP